MVFRFSWGLAGHQEAFWFWVPCKAPKTFLGALQAPQKLLWGPCRAPKPVLGGPAGQNTFLQGPPPKATCGGPAKGPNRKSEHQQHVLQPPGALAGAPEGKTQGCSHPCCICAMFLFWSQLKVQPNIAIIHFGITCVDTHLRHNFNTLLRSHFFGTQCAHTFKTHLRHF